MKEIEKLLEIYKEDLFETKKDLENFKLKRNMVNG